MKFVKVCRLEDVANNDMKSYEVDGRSVLVVNLDGRFYAVSGICNHLGGQLEKGILEGHTVICPWNASAYDVTTGKLLAGPSTRGLQSFDVKIEDNCILVHL